MQYFLDIAAVAILFFIAAQDFRYRAVHWIFFPLLFAVFCASGIILQSAIFVRIYAINLAFAALQILCLWLYFFLRYRRRTFIDSYIGTGDLLMIAAICAAFSTVNFIVFYVLSLLLILTFYIFVRLFLKRNIQQIPLAGGMALIMIAVLALKYIMKIDLYNDDIALEFLKKIYL